MKRLHTFFLLLLVLGLILYTLYNQNQRAESTNPGFDASQERLNISVPDTFYFSGEKVPFKEKEVRERFEEQLVRYAYAKPGTYLMLKRSVEWFPVIEEILEEEDVPTDFKYLALVESNLTNAVSPVGAAGFWQLMPNTAREMGLVVNEEVDERFDPVKSTRAAARYLRQAHKEIGDWTLVAAAYNRGISGIQRILKRQQVDSYYDLFLNRETADYVFRLLVFKEIFEQPEKYQYHLPPNYKPYREPLKHIKVTKTLDNLAEFAASHGLTYKKLRDYNPWLVGMSLTIPDSVQTSYLISLPSISQPIDQEIILSDTAS